MVSVIEFPFHVSRSSIGQTHLDLCKPKVNNEALVFYTNSIALNYTFLQGTQEPVDLFLVAAVQVFSSTSVIVFLPQINRVTVTAMLAIMIMAVKKCQVKRASDSAIAARRSLVVT